MSRHHAARSLPGTLLWRTHVEARALWVRILVQVPDPEALCLMPDHLHLLHVRDVSGPLGLAMNAYARWLNPRRGRRGAVWRPQDTPTDVIGGQKRRRSVRYVHLNPCRARLVDDPLAWPWSTHRDRVGLAWPGVVRRSPDPHGFHRYVSSDPTVHVQGTELPLALSLVEPGAAGLECLRGATSEILRLPLQATEVRGRARTVWLRAARCLSPASTAQIAAHCGLTARAIRGVDRSWAQDLSALARAAGDPRFPGLAPGDLRWDPRWARYRWRD